MKILSAHQVVVLIDYFQILKNLDHKLHFLIGKFLLLI